MKNKEKQNSLQKTDRASTCMKNRELFKSAEPLRQGSALTN